MPYQEPYFMQQLHKQREKESRIIWRRFKGDLKAYKEWAERDLEDRLHKIGFEFQKDRKGHLRLKETS